jgi:hypothetical protein
MGKKTEKIQGKDFITVAIGGVNRQREFKWLSKNTESTGQSAAWVIHELIRDAITNGRDLHVGIRDGHAT